jgi:hypothetical protein
MTENVSFNCLIRLSSNELNFIQSITENNFLKQLKKFAQLIYKPPNNIEKPHSVRSVVRSTEKYQRFRDYILSLNQQLQSNKEQPLEIICQVSEERIESWLKVEAE